MWLWTGIGVPEMNTSFCTASCAAFGPAPAGARNRFRSASVKRRSRRRPTRRARSRPLSLHLRTDAWLTRRKPAASAVFSSLSLIVTLVSRTDSIAEIGLFCSRRYGASRLCYERNQPLAGRPDVELRQLRAFVHVANTRHFGRAAVEVLLPYANSLIQVENRALRDLADNAAGRAGSLRVAYLLHGDVGTQGKIVAEFRRRYQDVAVETTVAPSKSNLEHLMSGAVDAAFIATPHVGPEVAVKQTGRRALMLAMPTAHPLAKLDSVPASSLRGVPMIVWPRSWNPEVAASFRQWLARNIGEEPNIVAEEPTEQAFVAVASSGSTVTVASSWRAAAAPITGIAIRPLVPQPLLDHEIAYLRDNPSPALQNLLRITDEIAKTNHSEGLEGDLL